MISRWCVGILVDARFADMPFVRYEQELPNRRRLWYVSDATMAVAEGDPGLQSWFFEKSYTSVYYIRSGTHQARNLRNLEFEICDRAAMHNSVFVGWHNLVTFALPPKNCHRRFVTVPAFWQNSVAHRMLCVWTPFMFAYYSSAFGDNGLSFSHSLLETTMTQLTIMSFVCYIQAAKDGAASLFFSARHRAIADGGFLRASERVVVSLLSKMRANFLKRGLLRLTRDCEMDLVAAILDFARVGETDRTATDSVGRFLNDFVVAAIIFVL